MKKFTFLFAILLLVIPFILRESSLYAEPDCDSSNLSSGEIDVCVAKLKRDAEALAPAHENNKKELSALQTQITNLKNRIANMTKQLKTLEGKIAGREKDVQYTKGIFEEKASAHYRFLRLYDPLLAFFSSDDAKSAFVEISLTQKTVDGDRKTMSTYADDLARLRTDTETLAKGKSELAAAQASVDKRAQFLAGEVAKVETYLQELSSRQQELLAIKAGGFSTSIGDTPSSLEPCAGPPGSSNFCDPGFKPAFAAFSFGAPHRTGMSQYGALGRAKAGQSAETILNAYYQGASLRKDYPVPATIGVTGRGRVPFEENYLLGIYEVPESWGDQGGLEALKAQAVAARSYALATTNNGSGTICTTEACQVYKPQLKSGKWAEAVRATRGWVMVKDGAPAKTYFASTSGGFTISQWGWTGIKDASGSWPDSAYEKIGGSPWFYKGWYKSRSGATCGRSGPWLTSAQMADILNAWHVLYKGGGDTNRITPLNDGCWSGNPYSVSELQSIGGYTSVDNVSVVYGNNGTTQTVNLSTNKGSVSLSGEEFRKAFNLRAPGNVGAKSSLFNIEKL